MSEEYVRIRGRLKAIRNGSVLFAVGQSVERAAWIPRSLIHGADERTLDSRMVGEEITLRIFEWKADEVGFTSDRHDGGAARDLFQD